MLEEVIDRKKDVMKKICDGASWKHGTLKKPGNCREMERVAEWCHFCLSELVWGGSSDCLS